MGGGGRTPARQTKTTRSGAPGGVGFVGVIRSPI